MSSVTLSNYESVQKLLGSLDKNAQTAAARACKRTASWTRTRLSEYVRIKEGFNLKKSTVDKQINVRVDSNRKESPAVTVFAKKRGLLLSRFPYKLVSKKRNNPGGIRVQIKRGKWVMFRHAFIVNLLSGNGVGIAEKGRNGKRMRVLHTASVSQMFAKTLPSISKSAQAQFLVEFKREFARLEGQNASQHAGS